MAHMRRQINRAENEESHLVLFGPTLVGKGKCVRDIENEFTDQVYTIGIGQKVREKLQNNAEFRQSFGALIKSGNLLPKEEVDAIALECYRAGRQSGYKYFVWDGYGRTEDQFLEMISWGVLTPNRSKFVMLAASINTCMARLAHAKKYNTRHGRNDDDNLAYRHGKHMEKVPKIISRAKSSGIKIILVDADRCLEKVSKEVVGYARQLFASEAHRQKLPSESFTPKPPYKSDTDFFHCRGLTNTTRF